MRVSPAPPSATGPQNTALSHAPHSPHMSPAVGAPGSVVMPPHPGSGQGENRNSTMHAPGYPPGGPPHMPAGPPGPHGYPSKMGHMPPGPPGAPGAPYGQPTYQQAPGGHQYPPTRPQGHMMQPYPPQNYPPPSGAPQGPPQGPQGHQYGPRAPHNSHVPPGQPYGYSHFGQQNWGQGMGQPMMGSGMPGKGPSQMPGQPAPGAPPGTNSVGAPRQPFLKHHIQHKMGGYPQPSSGPQMYPNGPGMPPGMVNSTGSPQNNMPPPTSTPQSLPPSSTPNMEGELTHPPTQQPPGIPPSSAPPSSMPPLNSTNTNSTPVAPTINSVNCNPPQIGPDGTPLLDEASQQSTVSNTSAASGDDRSCTPKPHMAALALPRGPGDVIMGAGGVHPPHTPTPVNSVPSPGTASMTSQQDEFENVNSPGTWPPRSPSGTPVGTPVYANSQPPPPPEIYRPTKGGDSIMRLYEMSDSPERRAWLDKLLRFMEDNKTPITACPTISKNPLDLYALYLHVRERGGFEEVTKNKHWKDVAAVMGIGASSSGSYTLRRHYMKHILSYECKFDRGGIDPQPIISQIEMSQKKKTTKTLSVPSPGSNSSSMDGFPNGPHMPGGPGMPGPYSQYPPSSEYPGHMQQRPPNQSTPGYQGYQGSQYPGYQQMHGGYTQGGFPNSGFPPDNRGYQAPPPNHQGNFQGYQQGYQRPGFPPPPPQQGVYQQEQYPMANSGPATSCYGGSQLAKQLMNPPVRNAGPVMQGFPFPPKPGASPSPGPQPPNAANAFQSPRRHPDFDKGWRPPSGQFGPYPAQGPPQVPGQQPWPRPNESGPTQGSGQWTQPRYPPPSQPFPNQPRWPSSGFGSPVSGPRAVGPSPGAKNYLVPPPTSFKSGGYGTYMGKQLFPMDSVESVTPVLVKRKRMSRADVSPVDPWRLLMSLRCGLSSEVTWALDVLNILLFDDQTVVYFGLNHMPGLLETIIEHLRRGLINMFSICSELELGQDDLEDTGAHKRIKSEQQHTEKGRPWFARPPPSPSLELDLGRLEGEPNPSNKETFLRGGVDYTLTSRTGKPVRVVRRDGQIFMREGCRDWDKWDGFDSGMDSWAVGGGECTTHIICSMQSDVPPIPFTRLIPDKVKVLEEKEEVKVPADPVPPTKGEVTTESKQPECRKQCVIKIEKMDIDVEKNKQCGDKVKVETTTTPSTVATVVKSESKDSLPVPLPAPLSPAAKFPLPSQKDKNVADLISDKCNGPKETCNKSIFSSGRFSKKNNAKTSKLDAIVKRIKKDQPVDSSSLSLFNKTDKLMTQSDSKSLLDHYLKKEDTSHSNKTEVAGAKANIETKDSAGEVYESDQAKDKTFSCGNKLVETVPPKPYAPVNLTLIKITGEETEEKESRTAVKRPIDDLEEESWGPDEASLSTTNEGQDWLARRVIATGTVVRNLSFIPGNEDVMSKNAPLLALFGKTILLHHHHPARVPATAHYDRDEEADLGDWCSSLATETHWWWPFLHHIHENTLVSLANIAGHLDLSNYPEEISMPILNGLLHWATCPASYGQDTLPGGGSSPQSALSPQRIALEVLVKLCVLDSNTDLVLATPPFSRLEMLFAQLTRLLCKGEDQVAREFAINLFHYFSAADSGVARAIAMQGGCISLLIAFIEEAESAALSVANQQGVSKLKENPELMGTSLDMVRRSANTLVNLSRVPDNSRLIAACENRFLTLVMSQILDTYVASQLSQVLFNVAQVQSDYKPPPSPPLSPSALDDTDPTGEEAPTEGDVSDKPPSDNVSGNVSEKGLDFEPKKRLGAPSGPGSGSPPQAPSPAPVSSASSSTVSASSSSSSPMSVTSHPPLSPSSLPPHATTCGEASISHPKAAAPPPQATPTL